MYNPLLVLDHTPFFSILVSKTLVIFLQNRRIEKMSVCKTEDFLLLKQIIFATNPFKNLTNKASLESLHLVRDIKLSQFARLNSAYDEFRSS